jgi:hypothetical protein
MATGALQYYIVPAGIRQLDIDIWGAGGAGRHGSTNINRYTGGSGAHVKSQLKVTPGTVLTLAVG